MFVSSRTSLKWFSSVTGWRCKIKPIFTLAGRNSFKRLDLAVIVRSISTYVLGISNTYEYYRNTRLARKVLLSDFGRIFITLFTGFHKSQIVSVHVPYH